MTDQWLIRIGPRGRLTIPKELRDIAGIRPGDYVIIEEVSGGILIQRADKHSKQNLTK